jgi:hypothetical protein
MRKLLFVLLLLASHLPAQESSPSNPSQNNSKTSKGESLGQQVEVTGKETPSHENEFQPLSKDGFGLGGFNHRNSVSWTLGSVMNFAPREDQRS